ncbi:MAG: fatty-acid--CoA ligase [Acidobacteria bacterium]|nr:MAG: fatty-acid--CoA ligase [Acidobacteriota bacterium]
MHISQILQRAAQLFPNQLAVVDSGQRISYAQLARRVEKLAAELQRSGITAGDRIAILDVNSLRFLETYFAAAALDAIFVPLNHRLSEQELEFIIEDSGSKIILGDVEAGLSPAHTATEPPIPDIAHLYYTSGTTGIAKGVMLTHNNVCTHALAAVAELQLTDQDVWAHIAPMFHLADAWAVFAITWVGGCHVMLPKFEAHQVLSLFERERITITNLIPTMLHQMIQCREATSRDYSSLRMLLSGGAPIAPRVVEEVIGIFKCEYVQTYGMTETSPYLTLSLLKNHLKNLSVEEQITYRCKTGRPFLTVDLRVVNDKGEAVPADDKTVGEIWVRGDTVTPGYWNRSEETRAVFQDGWLKTGDLATIDPAGYVNIVDRKKDMILSGGENIYSIEVEHALYSHPKVSQVAVFGVPDDTYGEIVRAAVVLKADQSATAEELIYYCKQQIASYKAPKSIDFLSELPRTGSGKIYKKALRDPFWKR